MASASLLLFYSNWFLLVLLQQTCLASTERSIHVIHFDESFMPKVFVSHQNWHSSIIDSMKSSDLASSGSHDHGPQLIYSYNHAFHGFSAMVSDNELETLKASPGFISAHPDRVGLLDTTHSTDFLNLSPAGGLWPASYYGRDTIIGFIDTGIWPESPSFRDDGMTEVPAKWKGVCEEGQEFNSSHCNKKLIGARSFSKAAMAANPDLNLTMNSPRDIDGHGTHVASTAAGNYVQGASHFGYAPGTARGVAPRARIAVYKVLSDVGTQESDVLAGIDQAVADGVDVLSISLGFPFTPLYQEPISVASFGAMEKGIFVSTSAGNRGLERRAHNGIPWALTVGASTIDRFFTGTITLGNGVSLQGWTMYPAPALVDKLALVYDKNISSCNSTELLSNYFNGGSSIILCDDIDSFRQQLDEVARSEWGAGIFISDNPIAYRSSDFPLPGVIIRRRDAPKVIEYAKTSQFPVASIKFQQTLLGTKPAPAVADFSSRGPSPSYPGLLKPDVLAPGVLILAAYSPVSASTRISPSVRLSADYYAISGTSMACPHASGVAALLKGAHPEWSPAAIRSAMITTASQLDNTGESIKDIAFDYAVATPLAMGAGHIDPNRARNPGLIYDASVQDYVNLICSFNYSQAQFQSLTRSTKFNCSNPSSDLNYPAFMALYEFSQVNQSLVHRFKRTVTHVGDGVATYKANVVTPKGTVVRVSPETLVFSGKYEKRSYSLSIRYRISEYGDVPFGSITWVDTASKYSVRSPIVVSFSVETW